MLVRVRRLSLQGFTKELLAVRFFLKLKIPDKRFRELGQLTLDGDKWTYELVGGFGDDGKVFRIPSLDGINELTGLQDLDLTGGMLSQGVSLQPLVGLAKLKRLEIHGPGPYMAMPSTDYEALLELTCLRELKVMNFTPAPARGSAAHRKWVKGAAQVAKVVQALAKRGVKIEGVEPKFLTWCGARTSLTHLCQDIVDRCSKGKCPGRSAGQ